MKPSILVIDAGNTSTALGLYRSGRVRSASRLATAVRDPARIAACVRRCAGREAVAGVILASVVPAVNSLWRSAARKLYPRARFVVVTHRLNLGVAVTYPRPETIGADRLANACAAVMTYGAPVIVADFGTAVTFDVVSRTKGYIGGVIAPGLPLMFSYLAEKTALLPRIRPRRVRAGVGRSTESAMRLGAVWGYRGLVREILRELKRQFREKRVRVCATGGYAGWVLRGSGMKVPIDPDLTLRGLGRIYELNA